MMLGGIVLTKGQEEERRKSQINKGVEVMLRKTNKKEREVPKKFQFYFGKMFSLFGREFHFNVDIYIKKK